MLERRDEIVPERVTLLKVPVDIVQPEALEDTVLSLLRTRAGGNIVLLSLWDLLRARRNAEYRTFLQGASLVLPISRSIVSGAKFLLGKKPVRYMPFDFVISLLSTLNKRELTVYLLGGKRMVLRKAEANISETFHELRVVGRYPGMWRRGEEATLIEAIRKAAPTLLLVNKGVRGAEDWISRHSALLNHGFRLWCSDLFEVFAGKKKRQSRRVFDRGMEWMGYCAKSPVKLLRVFPYMYYKILLAVYKIFKI
jgi:N-acetylglucosaminyldiphosphoundecaprenol N-acetyl-beta-D-mannosaminyltransferase